MKGITERLIGGLGWLLVILGGITISSWSLYSLARNGHVPIAIACLTGVTYDGLAFVSSVQAMAWNRLPNAYGIGSRLAMLAAAGLSAYLNYEHGRLMGVGVPVSLMLAAAPLAGLWALENHVRYLHRSNTRRIPLPKPEAIVWLLFPLKAWLLLRSAVELRLQDVKVVQIPQVSNEAIRLWLRENGYQPAYSGPITQEHKEIYLKAMKALNNGGGS